MKLLLLSLIPLLCLTSCQYLTPAGIARLAEIANQARQASGK